MISWTIIILSVYLVVILTIGFFSGRGAGKDAESFFVANRHLSWLQESMAVVTTIVSAAALVGTIGLFYADGADMLGYVIGFAFLMPLTYWYIGSRLRRLGRARGYQTQAVFIGDFYHSRYLHWCIALAGIIFAIPYFMTSPVAMGFLLNRYTGIPYPAGVLIFVTVSAVYTLKGGLRAVANTDIFHGALLLVFLLVTVVTLMMYAGGLWHVLDVTPKAMVSTSGRGMKLFLSWIIYMGFGACVQPDRCFRMFAVRDENNMRKGVIISGAMVGFAAFSYLSIAMAVRAFLPNIKNTDTTMAIGLQVAAAWLIPWLVMNAWGSGMSNFTAGLLSTANIFIKDIFEPWYVRRHNVPLGPKRDRLIMIAARTFIVCIVLITVCVSFYPPVFIWTLMNLWAGSFIQFFPLFVLGFLWRGVTRLGASLGLTSGILCMVLWSFFLKSPLGLVPGINALAVNTVVLIVFSLLIPEKQELKDEREELRRVASPEAEADRAIAAASIPSMAK